MWLSTPYYLIEIKYNLAAYVNNNFILSWLYMSLGVYTKKIGHILKFQKQLDNNNSSTQVYFVMKRNFLKILSAV